MAYHADAFAAVVMISHGSLGGGLCACVDFRRSNMSPSSSIQACLEFASAFRTSSGFATDSNGGRFPRIRATTGEALREGVGTSGGTCPCGKHRVDSGRRNFISAQVGAAGEDAALLYDVVATAELDAARTPPSTSDDDDADALALMALSRS